MGGVVVLILFFYYATLLYAYLFGRSGSEHLYSDFYECGFTMINDQRLLLDIRYGVLGIIFLIYDTEILILVPLVVNSIWLHYYTLILIAVIIIILGISYWYEWERYVLQWTWN